jgi:hypothetical protein
MWTGGWDSTFRLLQLLLVEQQDVQPYYVIDRLTHRPAVPAERHAMREIRELLARRHPQEAGRLLAAIECPFESIAPDPQITRHFEASLRSGFIGGQYEWLARFCLQQGIEDMELAIHRDDKARELLAGLVDTTRVRLDRRFAGDSRYELFRFFRFPLFDVTKLQMRDAARRHGLGEFMALTWFCHRPIGGQPCGVCNPCIYTIQEGLGDRVPQRALRRYRLRLVPRIRSAVTRHTGVYLAARSVYRRIRGLALSRAGRE